MKIWRECDYLDGVIRGECRDYEYIPRKNVKTAQLSVECIGKRKIN